MKRKNAFTLIELLAVIVILAIIALIATPIILGIIEDARKDSFERSVELVISTTDLDISNKTYEEEYTYTIEDGNISNLEVGIKNTKGMNGSITYNYEGKEEYAIHNGVYCVKKTFDMEKAEISEYDGECILEDKSVLSVITSQVPEEGNAVTFENGQLINLGTYGIRYQGSNPDNYVYFNCNDYSNPTSETCELWRIIGVVDGKVKIIKSISIENKQWDDPDGDTSTEDGTNNWANSTLKTYLNGEYYNSLLTKNAETENMISPSTWYLRGHNTSENVTKQEMYDLERTTGTVLYETPQIDNTNIGIMYPSDYAYAALETDSCPSTQDLFYYRSCNDSNWIIQGFSGEDEWLITPNSVYSYLTFTVMSGDYAFGNVRAKGVRIRYPYAVRPSLYLTSDIEIQGEGTQNSPFELQAK